MKTKLLFCFLMSLMVLGFGSCKKATYLKADKESVTFERAGGEVTIKLSSDVPDYNFESGPDWVTAVIQDSKLVIKAPENNAGAAREGELVITDGDQKLTIKVTQAYVATKLEVTETSVTIPKEGGEKEVDVETDGSVQVEAPDFVTATYADGKLTIKVEANDGGSKKGTIKLTADDLSATIEVTQEGNICQTCNGSGRITCPSCGGRGWYDTGGEGGCCTRCGGVNTGDPMIDHNGSGSITCPDCGGTGH